MNRFATIVALLLMGCGLIGSSAQAQSGSIIRDIVVEGAQRVEPETVLSYMLIRKGDIFNQVRIDRSLKKLFGTGLFADVSLERRGALLYVRVVENPVINRIAFEGNRRIEDKDLEQEVTLRPRIIYTRTKVQNDVQRILGLYRSRGRFAATVDPKVIQLEQNRVDLVFEISEGKATEVERIRFVGNREFSDSRLREEIRTKETRWWRFLSGEDSYDPDRLAFDRELLRRFYLNEGFADFQVMSMVAEMTPDREDFFITFTIAEGPRYELGQVTLSSNIKDFNVEDVEDVVEIENGDWYEADQIEKTVTDLTNEVGELGVAFVDVRPNIKRNKQNNTIDINFAINEGARVFVERIDINGNVRTEDKVIRREFRLVEGDPFNQSRLRRSRQRIQDLNFFEKVEVEQVPGSAPDKTVVEVEVEEKSTGSLSLGAGFSTTNGALAEIGVQESNLLGKGQKLSLSTTIAQRQSKLNLSFTEPYFLDREVSAGFDLFHTSTDLQDTQSHDTSITGGALRAGYPITERLSQSWRYTLKQTEVTNVKSTASSFIKSQEGTTLLSELTHNLIYDRRDSKVSPTDGYVVRLSNDLGGLGGDRHYIRNSLSGAKYIPVDDQWILSFKGTVGHIYGIGEDVVLIDRFNVGGDDLRGFATAGIGPRDSSTDDALGGEWKYTGSTQLTFPVGLPNEFGIKGRVFSDFGSLGGISPSNATVQDTGSIRVSAGFGVGWESPVGPIGVDFGFPIVNESFDEKESFRINFGTRF
ncbi:outer membrane protein assembly factor BamA [Magnetospira sp. QH-2]|uniref:outer membrane protein assembly factor BamA n=1 Tax=Magnetospira sp. (strain QH-2) TaxID=1288970 RepID=UPI0003E817D3|nr:outer membrane protein assembly factor BamA [Magnetospira sp. QH-2]CCQ73980.1 Putative bacterial surface antigen [Magnetospira sp. QH-2]